MARTPQRSDTVETASVGASVQAAAAIQSRINAGRLIPGMRLSETALAGEFGVSRNTLREAFRFLIRDGLLVHNLNRGVFVRELDHDDIADVFRVRRLLEHAGIEHWDKATATARSAVEAAVAAGERHAQSGRWLDVGTANQVFHQALVDLAGSTRLSEYMSRILAQTRLIFGPPHDPKSVHEAYVQRNRQLLEALKSTRGQSPRTLLAQYLDDAEQHFLSLSYITSQ